MAARVKAPGADVYSLLSAVGRDCVGALQFLPQGEEPGEAGAIAGREVSSQEIARIIADLAAAPLGLDEEGEFRISLAGAQEKTALLHWQGKWHVPHGATATTHILKPRIRERRGGVDLGDSVENEYLCMKLAGALGLPVAPVEIQAFAGEQVLVVERFDRLWTKDKRLLRIPQEDCCQALAVPPALKYEPDGPGMTDILSLLKASDDPAADQKLFLMAQIRFWLLGAMDGHAKNFSIRLMPAAVPDDSARRHHVHAALRRTGPAPRNQLKLAMAAGDNRHRIIAGSCPGISSRLRAGRVFPRRLSGIVGELAESFEFALNRTLTGLPPGFPEELAGSITGGLRSRARLLDRAGTP